MASEPQRSAGAGIPTPPPGYSSPRPLPQSMVVLLVGSFVLTVGALFGAAALYSVLGGSRDVALVRAPGWLVLLFGLAFTAVCHEGIHGLAYRYFGYEVEYGFTSGGLYTAAPRQIHTREESILITVAPVLSLTVVGLVCLLVPSHSLGIVGVSVLVLNTSGSIADLEQLCRLLGLPNGTLLCDADATYAYLPAE